MVLESVALLGSNGVLVVEVFETFPLVGRHDSRDPLEQARILRRIRTPRALPVCKVAKLDAQNRRLNFVEAAVPAGLAAYIFGGLTVIAQRTKARGDFCGVGDDHSAVAVGAEIFCRVETKATRVADGAHAESFISRANSLRTVFNQRQLARIRDGHDGNLVRSVGV